MAESLCGRRLGPVVTSCMFTMSLHSSKYPAWTNVYDYLWDIMNMSVIGGSRWQFFHLSSSPALLIHKIPQICKFHGERTYSGSSYGEKKRPDVGYYMVKLASTKEPKKQKAWMKAEAFNSVFKTAQLRAPSSLHSPTSLSLSLFLSMAARCTRYPPPTFFFTFFKPFPASSSSTSYVLFSPTHTAHPHRTKCSKTEKKGHHFY